MHVDPSDDPKEYVHRSGRTARAGASGVVVTLALPHQTDSTRSILSKAEVEAEWHDIAHEGDEALRYVGGRTPSGEPAEDPARVKYKGAPRKLNLSRGKGANARNAEARRENERRRAVYNEEPREQGKPRNRGTSNRTSRKPNSRNQRPRRPGTNRTR